MQKTDAISAEEEHDLSVRSYGEGGEVDGTRENIKSVLRHEIQEVEVSKHVHNSEKTVPEMELDA